MYNDSKYLGRIDKLFARCYKLGYCSKQHSILDIRHNREKKLWRRISSTNTALSDLSPSQRTRQLRTRPHNYILPNVRTSRFKSVFINRCLLLVMNICELLHVCFHNYFLIRLTFVISAFERPIFEIFLSRTGQETPEKTFIISDAVKQTDNFISFNRKTFLKFFPVSSGYLSSASLRADRRALQIKTTCCYVTGRHNV